MFNRSLSLFTYGQKRRLRSKAFFLDKYYARVLWQDFSLKYSLKIYGSPRVNRELEGLGYCARVFGAALVAASHRCYGVRVDKLIKPNAVLQAVNLDLVSLMNSDSAKVPDTLEELQKHCKWLPGWDNDRPLPNTIHHTFFPHLEVHHKSEAEMKEYKEKRAFQVFLWPSQELFDFTADQNLDKHIPEEYMY